MKTVIGFDSWTGGVRHYVRLNTSLRNQGYRLLLIHLGSWGVDPDRPKVEYIEEMEVHDISYYNGASFDQILEREKPVAVLFLSNDVFAHRAFNRYSLNAGIPTLRLYHGLVKVQSVNEKRQYKLNIWSQTRFILDRLPKALLHIWPCYARALWRTGGSMAEWGRFVTDIFNLASGKYIQRGSDDSRTTACAVYTQSDVSHAVDKYGHSPDDVYVVGNPDLISFGLTADDIGVAVGNHVDDQNEIIYVDTGLIHTGMVFDGADDFFAHIIHTRDKLAEQGYGFAIKLHPHHFRTSFPSRLSEAGVTVLDNSNFVSRLRTCAAAIVEPSTAAIIPALIGVPLALAAYGKLAGQSYGEVLLQFPRASVLADIQLMTNFIESEKRNLDVVSVYRWIDSNSGPLPAAEMPSRVANVIHKLAVGSRTRASLQN